MSKSDRSKTRAELIAELEELRRRGEGPGPKGGAGASPSDEVRQALTALKASEDRLRQMFDAHSAVQLLVDPQAGVIELANLAAAEYYGHPRSELQGMHVSRIAASPLSELPSRLEHAARAERSLLLSRHRLASGEVRDVEIYSSPVRVGGRTLLFAIIHDVTERRRVEEALRDSESRFRELVQASPDAIMVVQDRKIVFANPAILAMLGFSEQEFLGRSPTELVPPATSALVRERIRAAERGLPNSPTEFAAVRRDGITLAVESLSVSIQYDGRPAILVVARDISHHRQIEEERLKAQRLESIGVLAGGIAHDFNNILMSITGNLALAKLELNEGGDPRESLLGAEQAAHRARDLTRQLLTFARGGNPIIGLESVRDIITEAVGFVRHGSNVRCDLALADRLRPVKADAGQISQVIHNIVINAIQANPEGGKVLISADNARLKPGNPLGLPAGSYVIVSVADQGPGIPPENLPRIFDPYFTTKKTGSGLGLASAYSIVSRHQGRIAVESEVGQGTVFRVYLPAEDARSAPKSKRKTAVRKGSGKVLVMDDDPEVRRIVRRMLERLGFLVEEAEDGEEAIERFQAAVLAGKTFVAVIFDLTVPGAMGGREAVQRIKKIDPAVPAVVASGYSEDPVMANFEAFGFSARVVKPYKLEELDQVMQSVLHPRPAPTPE